MTDRELKVTIGSLLHDIGKIIYRDGGDSRTHSISGYDFLKNEIQVSDEDILSCVKYHHKAALGDSGVSEDSLAYVVYLADNIASSVDRRQKEEEEKGFEIHVPLQPVFNLLNENHGNQFYSPHLINMEKEINYPVDKKEPFSKEQYHEIVLNIADNLKGIELSAEYVNSLLEVMEANLSYVPSATSNAEVPDISLYDHLKITAAIAVSIVKYLDEQGCDSYKKELFLDENKFYAKDAFLIASIDLSGIQKFIYTIQTKNALRTLRARSFYLEITMEHIIDELLRELGLSRCNLLYAGGGHCYLLLPNTSHCESIFNQYLKKINDWFLQTFQTKLYAAGGYAACSANSLKNIPHGSYLEIFKTVSANISEHKLKRYDAETLMRLNHSKHKDYTRECSVCKSVADVDENNLFPMCAKLEKLSKSVLDETFFTVEAGVSESTLPLPLGFGLTVDNTQSLKNKMEKDDRFVRAYSKNRSYTGKHVATKLWVGDYSPKATFEEFANSTKGIKRVGILRADVDNLGHAFVAGFKDKANDDRYVTISRTAALSRQLSLFFKLHINKILEHPSFSLDGEKKERRNITIVYSGGDDVFVVGAWNEIIEFAIDLREAFSKYSENTLSISCGIGLYEDSFPISVSADEVEAMVERSKSLPQKNAITLLEDGEFYPGENGGRISDGTYSWQEFQTNVIEDKYRSISEYMDLIHDEKGNALLYRILELVRNQKERINFARFVYLLARLEPDADKTSKEMKEGFAKFSQKMITWIKEERDQRQLKTAIELYVYLHRGEEDDENN